MGLTAQPTLLGEMSSYHKHGCHEIMQKFQISSSLVRLFIGAAASICLLLSSTLGFADTKTNKTTTTDNLPIPSVDCRLVANPDECYYQQAHQKGASYTPTLSALPPINTQAMGLDGPFSAELKYDSYLSWMLGLNYLQMFGESAGLAGKFTAGLNEFRANLTAGYAFNKDNQLKLTYEYLRQNLPFDFASGSVDQWVDQNSLGAAYQYIIGHKILHSLELNAYATRARSKTLSDVIFNQQTINPNYYTYDVNYRHIAGGDENTILASANLYPFGNLQTTLTLGAGYSEISYDTLYQTDDSYSSNDTIAYQAELTHILTSKDKFVASVNSTAASVESVVKFSHILRSVEAAVEGQYVAGQAGLVDSGSVILSLTYPAPKGYSVSGFGELQEFKNWVDKPVVYSARVLAIKDEQVKTYTLKAVGTIADQNKSVGESLDSLNLGDYFFFDDPSAQVNYKVLVQKISAGKAISATSANKAKLDDYTQELNLHLLASGGKHGVLKSASAAGFPAKDSTGDSTGGIYQVTIIATSALGMSVSSGFKLTLGSDKPPVWISNNIPDASMGFAYSEVDVTSLVDFYDPDKSVTIDYDTNGGRTNPVWLHLVPCSQNAAHQCLSSEGVPVPASADTSFTVNLKAVGTSTNLSASQELKPGMIATPPMWDVRELPSREYTDSTKIYLKSYVKSGTQGLVMEADESLDSVHWQFGQEGDDYFIQLQPPFDPNYVGLKQIPLKAKNNTSFGEVKQTLSIYVTNNNLPDPVWNNASIPAANMGFAYEETDLTSQVTPSVENGHVSFGFEGFSPSWLDLKPCSSDNSHICLVSKDKAPVPNDANMTSFAVSIKAHDDLSAREAVHVFENVKINQLPVVWANPLPEKTLEYNSVNNTRIYLDKSYIADNMEGLTVVEGAGFDAEHWAVGKDAQGAYLELKTGTDSSYVGIKNVPVLAKNTTSYTDPNKLPQMIPVIVFNNGLTAPTWVENAAIPAADMGSAYAQTDLTAQVNPSVRDSKVTFNFVGSSPSWLALGACQAPLDSTHTCLLANGNVPNDTDLKAFTVTINAHDAFSTHDVEKTFSNVAVNQLLPEWASLKTINLSYNDSTKIYLSTYVTANTNGLAFVEGTNFDKTHWKLDKDENGFYLQLLGNPAYQGAKEVPVLAINTTSFGGKETLMPFNITLEAPMFANATGSIPFSTTGDGGELGSINNGVNLTSMIANRDRFSPIRMQWSDDKSTWTDGANETVKGNWQIKALGDQYYLLRAKNADGTVSASGIDNEGKTPVVIPSIKVCGTASGAELCSSSSATSGSNTTVSVTVLPSAAVVYELADANPSYVLRSATSDGTPGGRALLAQPNAPSLKNAVKVYTSSDVATRVQVVDDTAVQYEAPASAPAYVDYKDISNSSITFKAPTASEYNALVGSGNANTTYLRAKSAANGGKAVDGNIKNLKPITVNELILVPQKGTVNQPYAGNAGGANITVGVGVPGSSTGNFGYTSLAFTLPQAPAGKQFYVKNINYTNLQGNPAGTVDQGAVCAGATGMALDGNAGPPDRYPPAAGRCGGDESGAGSTLISALYFNTSGGTGSHTANLGTGAIGSKAGDYRLWLSNNMVNNGRVLPTSYLGMDNIPPAGRDYRSMLMLGKDYSGYSDFPKVTIE